MRHYRAFFLAAILVATPAAAQCVRWSDPFPHGSAPPQGAKSQLYHNVARYWAPVISHDIDDDNVRADYITNFDFDRNLLAKDNARNLNGHALSSYVYYWVLESRERYFVGYAFFHPFDWSSHGADEHVNDLEGAMVTVRKVAGRPYGIFEGMVTEAHGFSYGFADDDSPKAWYDDVRLSQALRGADEDVDFVIDDFGFHPVVYIQSEGHGAYGHPFRTGDFRNLTDWNPIFITNKVTDWRARSFAGQPSVAAVGGATPADLANNWGDGITYHFEGTAESVAPAGVTAAADLPHDWRIVGYDLLSIKWLWDCRKDARIFKSNGEFKPGGANPP